MKVKLNPEGCRLLPSACIFGAAMVAFLWLAPSEGAALATILNVLAVGEILWMMRDPCDAARLVMIYVGSSIATGVLFHICVSQHVVTFHCKHDMPMWLPCAGGVFALAVLNAERTLACVSIAVD